MRRTLFAACLLLVMSFPVLAQRDFSDIEMKTIPVAGSVYMLVGAGGNIGVSAGDDGFLIVDDQFKPLADKIRAALADIGKGDLLEFALALVEVLVDSERARELAGAMIVAGAS